MSKLQNLKFDKIFKKDISVLSKIMKKAFDHDTSLHTDLETGGPSGYDDGTFLEKWINKDEIISFKFSNKDQVLGAFFISTSGELEKTLEMLFIDPAFSNQGFGYKAWVFIQDLFSETRIWKTSTPGYSKRNHNFYVNKCGFKIYKIDNSKNIYDECYYLEKIME